MNPYRLALVLTLISLTGCVKDESSAPTGQVVASIGGDEITLTELQLEVGPMTTADPATQKQIQFQALQNLLNRHLLAAAASADKLDQTPLAAMVKRKAEQLALVELLQQKLRSSVPRPSREEAEQYIASHPASFAQRRIFLVDQAVATNVPVAVVRAMEPLTTMEQIEALLAQNKIQANHTVGVIDALAIDAVAADKIAALAPGAVFVSPSADGVRINRVRETQIQPVTGDDAIRIATEALLSRRTNAQVGQQLEAIVKAGMAKVKYNAAFTPPAAKPAKAQPTG